MGDPELAVLVRGACKQYGGKDSPMILDHLDMQVHRGNIYGLLGASGCGKTTLLSALVGNRKLQKGHISVLGEPPGRSSVKKIGYMPQSVALVGEFTVKGALQHFGWIFGLTDQQIDERFEFLSKLLDLPSSDKMVKNLSGGQQRRVSLAVVLIHDPELLILDEPTVGVDPVLRQNIWDYLVQITRDGNKTVIITTHYIEEAKQANKIGLMRNGKLLTEGSPSFLLNKFHCNTVEEVFLLLSTKQQLSIESAASNTYSSIEETRCSDVTNNGQSSQKEPLPSYNSNTTGWASHNEEPKEQKSCLERLKFTNKGHAKALVTKNVFRIVRHPGGMCFMFGFPLIQVIIFFLCIGNEPQQLGVSVVNEELGNYSTCHEYMINNHVGAFLVGEDDCHYEGLGCKFIVSLSSQLRIENYYKTKEEAYAATKSGEISTYFYIRHNFSEAIQVRLNNGMDVPDEDLDAQEILIYQDMTERDIGMIVQRELLSTYKTFSADLATSCNRSTHTSKLPISFKDPVYGSDKLSYNSFMAPGTILTIVIFLSMSVSTLIIVTEREEGIWDRTIVSGVSTTEILIFHTLIQAIITTVQMLEVLGTAFLIFKTDCQGNYFTILCLVFLQSLVGVSAGIWISVFSRNITESNYVSMGSFYPFIVLSGFVWPLEGMPVLLRYISYFIPTTLAVDSLANIMRRGWGIANYHVYKGFLSSFGFIVFFTTISILYLKFQHR